MEFRVVSTVEEAVGWLAERGEETRVLAGGTDVMIQRMRGEIDPAALLFVGRIAGLDAVAFDGGTRIGALTTHLTLRSDPRVLDQAPALAEAAATVGGWQTQAVGTLGGNVCNASPAADTAPPLLAAGAVFELAGPGGTREVPAESFFLGRRQTARRPDELLTSVVLPPRPHGTGDAYVKVGRRSAMEVAVVGLAVRLTIGPAGVVERARIAACSVAPRPFRATEAESILQGSMLEDDAVAEAGRALAAAASPIDDARASAAYRLRVLPRVLAKTVRIAALRAGEGGGTWS
jgi:carbon-monoxide dehydrogenase medium subunit